MPNRTIYIHRHIDDKLEQEENISGLINKLLILHYATTRPGIVMPTVDKEKRERFEKLKVVMENPQYVPLEETA